MNFYDFHIGDYASRTAHLEPLEDIAYRRMLDLYYVRECALPEDVAEIARLIRMRSHIAEIKLVLQEFFTNLDGEGWMHSKCEEVIAKAVEKSGKASKSAKQRWGKTLDDANAMRTHSERMEDAMRTQCEGNAPSPSPSPTTHTQANACDGAADAAPPAKAKRGRRLAPDWTLPRAWGIWAMERYPHWTEQVVRSEAEKFANHFHAKTGKGSTSLDWGASWRNWCMNDLCQRTHPPPGQARETDYARQMRERIEQAAGSLGAVVAAKPPGQAAPPPRPFWETSQLEIVDAGNAETTGAAETLAIGNG